MCQYGRFSKIRSHMMMSDLPTIKILLMHTYYTYITLIAESIQLVTFHQPILNQ